MKNLLPTVLFMLALPQAHAQVNQYLVKQDNKPIANSYVLTKDSLQPQATDKTVFTLDKAATTKSLPPSTNYNITDSLKAKNPQMQTYKLDPKAMPNLPATKNGMDSILTKNKDETKPKKVKIQPVEEPGLLPHTK